MKYNKIILCFGAALLLTVAGCATLFNSRTELSDAASRGDIGRVQMLVDQGAKINQTDSSGQTALMHAICKKQTKTAIVLVNLGAEVDIQDKNGYSALSHAISYGNKELVVFLLEKGADLKLKDHYGYSYLHIAASYDQPEICKILLKNNMNISEKNTYGDTPLHVALTYRMYDTAKFLVDNGADINAGNNYGSTPLHYAVKYGQSPRVAKILGGSSLNRDKNAKLIIEYILSKNPDTEIRDSWDYTPAGLALYYKNKEMADMLAARSKGSNKKAQDEAPYGVVNTDSRYKIIEQTAGLVERIREAKEFKIRGINFSAVKANEIGYSNTEEWNATIADIPKTYADSCSKLLEESGAANKKMFFIKHDETISGGIAVDVAVKRIILNWNYHDKEPDVYLCDISLIDSRNGQKLFSSIVHINSLSPTRMPGKIPVNLNMPNWEGTFSGRLHIAAYNMAWVITKIIIDGKIAPSE